MSDSAFERYVLQEVPKRISTDANPLTVPPNMVPVTTGVGLMTVFKPYVATGGGSTGEVTCTIPFKQDFVLADWVDKGDGSFTITYTPALHLQGNTKYLTVFVYTDNKNVIPKYYISNTGDVVITAAFIFEGHIIISNLGVGTMPFKKEVIEQDWLSYEGGYVVTFLPAEHAQGFTKYITVFVYADNTTVPPKYQVTDTGEVSIYASIRFSGYVIISNLGNSLSHTATGDVPLAKLTAGGENGKLSIVNGMVISYVAPT